MPSTLDGNKQNQVTQSQNFRTPRIKRSLNSHKKRRNKKGTNKQQASKQLQTAC
jgi:hypothetical protein